MLLPIATRLPQTLICRRARFSVIAGLSVLLAACGGGGGGSATVPPPAPPAAPVITYDQPGHAAPHTLTTGSSVALNPTNTGGTATLWTVSPTLPAGLGIDAATGAITGTPTGAIAEKSYTVTATNAGGSGTASLAFGVNSALLNLGASCFTDLSGAFQNGAMAVTATNVLTLDCGSGTQHWVLWNYASAAVVAQGDACPLSTCAGRFIGGLAPTIGLAGPTAVVPYTSATASGPTGFRVVSTADGSTLATVAPSASVGWFGVATDGSYVCGTLADNSSLTVWAPDGSVLLNHAGNYAGAHILCRPGQVLVAGGAKGANVIESIAVPGGASVVSPAFAGTFNAWFGDGSAFLTNVGDTVWVYTPAAVQQDLRVLSACSRLGGWGTWFWCDDGTSLNVYKVGSSATPAATFASGHPVIASGSTLAVLGTPLLIVELAGAVPAPTTHTPPVGDIYAAVSASQWVTGGGSTGVIYDGASPVGTPRYFGYGRALGIAGSPSRFAIATSIGQVLVYDTADLTLRSTLNLSADRIALSGDGAVLAARSNQAGGVSTLALPAGTVIHTWASPGVSGITLSDSGLLLGQTLASGCQVTASNGGPTLWLDGICQGPVLISADDTLIASSDGTNTHVYLHTVLSSAVAGVAAGWLGGNYLYVNNGPASTATAGNIFSSGGIVQSGPKLPRLSGPLQVVGSSLVFDPPTTSIYSLTTGDRTWTDPNARTGGAVAGPEIVYVTLGNQLVVQPY